MRPSLGWVEISRTALAEAANLMAQRGDGTIDEVGLLALHRHYADRLFPGTSVLHTRLRYALFVPWVFERLATELRGTRGRAREHWERLEVQLARQLIAGAPGETGIIGKQVVADDRAPAQLAGQAYWGALGAWNILQRDGWGRPFRSGALLRHFQRREVGRETDDEGRALLGRSTVFVRLPKPPEDFLHRPLDFELTRREADFLQGRLVSARADGRESLLGALARRGAAPSGPLHTLDLEALDLRDWADELARAHEAAVLGGLARAVYNALVEAQREQDGGQAGDTTHRARLDVLARAESEDREVSLRVDVARLPAAPAGLRRVLTETQAFLRGERTLSQLAPVYEDRERGIKGSRRMNLGASPRAKARRQGWEGVPARPLHYRWPWVQGLLEDLARGLARPAETSEDAA